MKETGYQLAHRLGVHALPIQCMGVEARGRLANVENEEWQLRAKGSMGVTLNQYKSASYMCNRCGNTHSRSSSTIRRHAREVTE